MDLTRELAERVVATRFEDIPPSAVEAARRVLIDGLAVMLAGARDPAGVGQRITEYARSQGGAPEAGVVSGGFRTSASLAAFANGTFAHALDFDDTTPPVNHPGSSAIPAALALAEREEREGRGLLTAVVVGYEVQGRLRLAAGEVPSGEGFHKPGVFGLMGAVAAAGKTLALEASSLCHAFGIAGSRAGSLASNTGTMTKPTHAGHAARMGVECAELAALGWTAHPDIFGRGRYGECFFPGEADMSLLLKDFAAP
ncbi:MAG: MmgE/PrpD family protein, partial [Nitrospinota bacterium]